MGKGGRRKSWPRSWKQAAVPGGRFVLAGRSFQREYVVLPVRVEADAPEQLAEMVEEALAAETGKQRPS